jgi:hypothetical protein
MNNYHWRSLSFRWNSGLDYEVKLETDTEFQVYLTGKTLVTWHSVYGGIGIAQQVTILTAIVKFLPYFKWTIYWYIQRLYILRV